jgi:uncharacterized protein (TIGR00288 family)
MRHHRTGDGERILAVFIDFENLALGFAGKRDRFRIEKVLERLVEKGKLVAKKAYADWSRWSMEARSLHEAAIELIEIPKRSMTGKNSADIRLVVDAVDLAYSRDHIDTFVIVSGDSDFSPLVSKLKELGKHVIGLGLVEATSNLLRDNCDEFIYYEDLDRPAPLPGGDMSGLPEGKRKVFGLLLESLLALRRENKETIFSSMAKDTMKRKRPSFNEEYFGYRTFSELLEDAAKLGIVEIEKHKNSGTYVVTRFGEEGKRLAGGGLPHPQPMTTLPPRPQAQPQPLPPRESVPDPRSLPPRPALGPAGTTGGNAPRPSAITGPAAMAPRGPAGPARTPAANTHPPRPAEAGGNAPRTPSPVPVPPPTRRKPEEEEGPVLGRSLIDDVDVDDFEDEDVEFEEDEEADELPSYGPGRASKPVARPTRPPEQPKGRQGRAAPPAKPAAVKQPAARKPAAAAPAAKKPAERKPAAAPAAKKPAAAAPARKPAAKSPPPPPPRKAEQAPPPPPVKAPPPPVKKAPPKPPADDEGFGAGLDE